MYNIKRSKKFEKSFKRFTNSGVKKQIKIELEGVINFLINEKKLPIKYKDHALLGNLSGFRECHIRPDLLLIYKIEKEELMLLLFDIGSHSYLFR